MKRAIWTYLLPAILLLAVTLPHLDQGDFRTDTARYAAVGLQAWQDHSLFWTPHLHPDVPYFNKPPLVFWIHGLVLHLFGISLVAARLPTIMAAMGSLLVTVAIVKRLMGGSTAVATGIVLALTYEFVRRTREISLDMWQLCFMMATLWLVLESVRRRWVFGSWAAGVPLGLALMCKPLMAFLVMPFLIMATGRNGRRRDLIGLLTVTLLVAIPWHISMWHLHGHGFFDCYFGHEVMNRAMGQLNRQPYWFYFTGIGRSYWPWLIPAVAGTWLLVQGKYSRHNKTGLLLAGAWLTLWFLALSLFPDKRTRYGLPLHPALAVFSGAALARLPWKRLRRWHRGKTPLIMAGLIAAAGMITASLPLRVQAPPDPHLKALMEWVQRAGPDPIYSAALSTNDEGLFFLKTGHWPRPIPRRQGLIRADLPKGVYLIYSAEIPDHPGPNEKTVFASGQITVTRLGTGGWQPNAGGPHTETDQERTPHRQANEEKDGIHEVVP
jgi:4-amino-4-deoxy-L-arabinose transferase-like glycosyltransferase